MYILYQLYMIQHFIFPNKGEKYRPCCL
uniref:Uncharacterized protein n=1 Tax=Anguilla anguilla TaxID=7936 RepID=A0A0E9W1B1_ANGAN